MIIWGWGKVTRKRVASEFRRGCNYCNREEVWQLCIMRTWFTLFFIPIIPYKTQYCIACPNCGSYIELTTDQFQRMKYDLMSASTKMNADFVDDSMKYAGKTETQVNYLKQMEELNNK